MLTLRSSAYEFGPYRVDPLARSLMRNRELIALPPKAVEVLVELVKRPGVVISKKELMEAVWPETFVEEANLNQMIFLAGHWGQRRNKSTSQLSRSGDTVLPTQCAVSTSYMDIFWVLGVLCSIMFVLAFFLKKNDPGAGGDVAVG